ncbi:hypothetical protein JW968_03495 [Candidatus Woesearchaeota archaeon]|nr:hypothetical protein [Candidatus Woesearchaeota archaeon]
MKKRGQITPFIIMGILILILMSLIFYISSISKAGTLPTEHVEATRMQLNTHIQECVEMVSADSVYVLGLQGGYISRPEKVFWHNQMGTSILYSENKTYMPTLQAMEANLSAYVETFLPYCVNFSFFPGYEITADKADVRVQAEDGRILFDINWPITYSQGGTSTMISEWSTPVPIDLKKFHNITASIVVKTQKDPSYIDHIFLLSHAMNISYSVYNNTVVYDLRDVALYKDETDYVFIFAVETK